MHFRSPAACSLWPLCQLRPDYEDGGPSTVYYVTSTDIAIGYNGTGSWIYASGGYLGVTTVDGFGSSGPS